MTDPIALLRGTEFFRDLSEAVLADIADRCKFVSLRAGERLFEYGDPGDALYIIDSGSLELFVGTAHLDIAAAGACVGEMAMFGGWPRSASARAIEDIRVLSVPQEALGAVIARHGETVALGIIRELAAKLRSSIRVRVAQHDVQQRLRQAFAQSVSESVMNRMLEIPDPAQLLDGREARATVMFLDIRDSTTVTEKLSPRDVIRFVNVFIGPLVDIVMDAGGMIDRFTGDGFKACFGVPLDDPEHASHAIACTMEIRSRVLALNHAHRDTFPIGCQIGVGVSSGPVVIGCIGNARRMDFTVAGDVTNTAARVEGLTKRYRTDLLITGQTVALAGNAARFRLLDVVRVKGKRTATELYDLEPGEPELVRGFAEALSTYRAGHFGDAAMQFAELAAAFPSDGPSISLAERCKELAGAPPAAWDGIFDLKSK